MANKTIADYTAAVSIDATADYLLIEQSGVYKKINRNTLLALASAPLGTTDVQSPTNKTFDNSNSYTIKDGSLTLQNTASATKQATFSLASITAGQTRVITVPDANITLVGTAATQTLTNKTLTSPTISGGTIDNSTITVDSISGHTSATIVTVASLQISNGVLNSNASVVPNNLVASTGTTWAWSGWTPTFANFTLGNGSLNGYYLQVGKTVFYRLKVVLGTTSIMGTDPTITLPVTQSSNAYGPTGIYGQVSMRDDSASTWYMGEVMYSSATIGLLKNANASATVTTAGSITATVPMTWASADEFYAHGFYEAA